MSPSNKKLIFTGVSFVIFLVGILVLTGFQGSSNVNPLSGSSSMIISNWPTTDPCQSPSIAKSSVAISITSATTTQLVPPSGSTIVYVCGYQVDMSATLIADTIKFTTGTGATCGGSTVDKTGAMTSGVLTTGATTITAGWDATLFTTAPSSGVCAITTVGTGPSISGIMTFIQQ